MLNINDFILYLPLKGNTTDYSRNAYSVTNNSVTSTTDEFGISGGAYEWNSATDNLELSASVGNAYAVASNSGTSTLYMKLNLNDPGFNVAVRLFSQYGGAGNRAFAYSISTLSALNDNCYVRRYSSDGTAAAGDETTINSISYSTWFSLRHVINEDGLTNNDDILIDNVSDDTATGLNELKENSTFLTQIGYQNNTGGNNNGFTGKANNIMILNRGITSLEEKFINKFGNRKRVA